MQPTEKISQLPPKASLASTDLIPIVDVSTSTTKSITGAAMSLAFSTATNGWSNLNFTPTYVSNDGNKQVTLQVSSVDLTGTLSPGMKLKVTRGTTPNANSMAFTAASSQYATKASPSGISFTTTFTAEAWVYPNSYVNGTAISQYNGANGWGLLVLAGSVYLRASSTTFQNSYQAIPLKRWTHIAGTFSSGTMNIYFNGQLVPSVKNGSGTSITQAGALQVGAENTTDFFDGYIAEARVWSIAQSVTNIRNNMCLSLTTATSLVANFPGNGNFNDVSGNANNLTATNGAIATQAANPANLTEYAFITSVSYSAPNTTITVFTGLQCNIPNMTLSGAQYAIAKAPYGFPGGADNWRISSRLILTASLNTTSNASYGAFNSGAWALTVPIGSWTVGWQAQVYNSSTTVVNANISATALTGLSASAAAAISPFSTTLYAPTGTSTWQAHIRSPQSITTPNTYVFYTAGATTVAGLDINGINEIYAECGYV